MQVNVVDTGVAKRGVDRGRGGAGGQSAPPPNENIGR